MKKKTNRNTEKPTETEAEGKREEATKTRRIRRDQNSQRANPATSLQKKRV